MPEAAISSTARSSTLDRLEREPFDLVVIGGGISGAGVAREATQRGLSVALIEAEDFSSGTSSRSSKLIHGGLRYLAMGDVALVRTTALERKQIFRLAPHLSTRRWMVVPVRSWAGLVKIRAGVSVYEKLGSVEGEDRHRNWSGAEIAEEEPALNRDVYKHACVYREYLTDDAHLVLANLRSAVGAGAAAINHVAVDRILREGGIAAGVEAACRLSGRRVRVRARCVINAAGPWVEAVRRLEDPDAPPLLHLSKGVHIVLEARRLPVNNMIVCSTRDRRSIFVIRRGAIVYVGTTDTTYEPGSEVWPEIAPEDVTYLLEPIRRYFDLDQPLSHSDVIGAWAGLRPLIAEAGKEPHEISRRDEVLVGPGRVITMAGGKLTGYRPMARETVERAAQVCGLSLARATEEEAPLPGGDFDGRLEPLEAGLVRGGVSEACAARMVRLYGTEAAEVAAGGVEPLATGSSALLSEVDWAVAVEGAATAEDVLYRRIRSALYASQTRDSSVAPVVDRMAALLDWDSERRTAEAAQVRARLDADLAFRA